VRSEFGNDNNQIGGYCYSQWKHHKAKAAYVVQAAGDEYVTLPENEEDENADSLDDTKKPDINDMQWMLGNSSRGKI
jgi:hypothetical protein